jgi:alkanesulfonate monooxygenase SsuD/methylene tetrahydromethanopterin reductase-like flavin-dependent oxidoreductase (luciferase family)
MMQAIAVYRERFRPSASLEKPYVMLGYNVFAADTDGEARVLATSMQQAFVNLRSGRPQRLQPPDAGYLDRIGPAERALLDHVLACTAIGSRDTVARALRDFVALTGADELMIASQIFDHSARLRSYEIVSQARGARG